VRLQVDPSDFEPPPGPVLIDAGLAFIETHFCRESQQTRESRARYADEATGGWRSSAISCRMSDNRFRQMATAAFRNVTQRRG
jgi:hypothetical protein